MGKDLKKSHKVTFVEKKPRSLKMLFEVAPWSESHGYSNESFGAAPLYAVIAKSLNVRDVLVIGSGAGFTPKVFLENVESIETLALVDAFLAETGNGSPFDITTGNLDYPNIVINREKLEIFKVMSKPFLELAIAKHNRYDLIFIDGDHSSQGFLSDLNLSLECLRQGGAILFHDTKFDHIRKIADELLKNRWVNFEIGAGFGVYLENGIGKTKMSNEPLNSNEEKTLYEQSMAQRWDYLASEEFKQRNKKAVEMLVRNISGIEIMSALEIGGNPAPLMKEISELIEINSMLTVEPYISPIAQNTFEKLQLNGVEIVNTVSDIHGINFDLVCLLGVDLSLSKNYSELKADAMHIRNLFDSSKLVVTETSAYQPGKWLEKFLTENLTLLETTTLRIEANQKFSLNEEILTRQISIWRAPPTHLDFDKPISDSRAELIKYARWHALDGTPGESLPWGENGYEVQQALNSWQVELDPTGKSFVWLKSQQSISFPKGKKELVIHYSQGPRPTIFHNYFVRSEVSDSYIVLRRRFPLRRLSFTLSSWVPSQIDVKSSDHRELTIAAHAFEFN
jgi:hypothetical protein